LDPLQYCCITATDRPCPRKCGAQLYCGLIWPYSDDMCRGSHYITALPTSSGLRKALDSSGYQQVCGSSLD